LKSLHELFNYITCYDSFFIDEGQFFEDIYTVVKILVDTYHKHVVISGLDGDSTRSTFGDIVKLIPLCDTVDKLCAYCTMCNDGTLAPFTKKKTETADIIDIGGIEKYIPVCRYHYLN